jgi:cystathionine gamma-lyase
VDISYVDARDAANVAEVMTDRTKLVWMETPTNPLMKLCDIEAVSAVAGERGALVAVDNTFATPYFQKPLELGADIVVHSTSKYLNGHSDSVGGAVMLSNKDLYERLKFNQNAVGAVLAPFDSYLVLRGVKTLPVRMREHERNALLVAQYLESHPGVTRVLYPGLPSHPQHDLAAKQMSGFGGMLSFEIAGGLPEARALLQNLTVFSLAESLGGVESLIEHPALMTHASIPREEREKVGVTDSLVRISVGIENVDDLTEDLARGLAAAA